MIKPGSRWKSVVCTTEAVVVKPASDGAVPRCGGEDMVPLGTTIAAKPLRPGCDGGTAVGKRYRSERTGLEMLCTKPGPGALGVGDELLAVVEAKKLPASD
jgi:hypothetical protein